LMVGRKLKELLPDVVESGADLETGSHYYVKSPVFPWGKFPGVDTVLGPEMKSTGEVMGIDTSFEIAFADYSKDNLSRIHIAGVGNRFRTLYNSQPALNASAIAAAANSPGISNFNGGIALNTTAARITCAMVALSANGFQDYYVYFSMLDGYSNNVRASIRNDGGYPFIVSIEDESFVPGNDGHSGAGQVHIRVRTPIATAATTVELFIQVML